MQLRNFDLNLLTVFDRVMLTGSVNQAADMLDITSAAVSQRLRKLSDQLGETLFVRQGRGIQPTSFARNFHHQIAENLNALGNALQAADHFELEYSKRQFTLAAHRMYELQLVPALLNRFAACAPHLGIAFTPAEDDIDQPVQALTGRQVDLFISSVTVSHPSIRQQHVTDDEVVVICAHDHPRIQGSISREALTREKQMALSSRRLGDFIVSSLAQEPIPHRHVAYQSDSLLHLMATASTTELVCVTCRHFAEQWQSAFRYQILPLPLAMKPLPIYLCWNKLKDEDPGLNWFKQQVIEILVASR